jgi:site-specific recombinase XerD
LPLWSPEPEVLNSVPADPVMTIERAVDLYLEDKKEQQAGDALTGKRCHIHMFRDTFAVELLLAGVPIEQVSLGD